MEAAFKAGAWTVRASSRLFTGRRSWLDVRAVDIPLRDLAPAFAGYRIAHFSDLHFDGISTTTQRLDELLAAINALDPDLIAFTGDFVTHLLDFCGDDLVAFLRGLHARNGVVAVMGNHDHREHTERTRRAIRESGIIDLNNAVHSLHRENASLHLAGVDSVTRRHDRLDAVLRQLPGDGTAILLAHEPDFAEVSARTGRFALQLSGHTHGGQIRIPLLTRLFLPRNKARFLGGLTQIDAMQVYVNRGIGMVKLPLRVNCASELTVITLRQDPARG